MAMTALHESDAVAPAPAAGRPWYIAQLVGRADRAALAGIDGVEVFSPMVIRFVRLPRKQLSRAQRRAAGAVVKAQPRPLLPGFIFLRGCWWNTVDRFRGGFICGADGFPLEIPHPVVERIAVYCGDGAAPGTVTLRRLLGIATAFGGAIDAALGTKIADIDEATFVKVLAIAAPIVLVRADEVIE